MRGPYAKVAARNGALLERVRELKCQGLSRPTEFSSETPK
jgi:hypothetical protein